MGKLLRALHEKIVAARRNFEPFERFKPFQQLERYFILLAIGILIVAHSKWRRRFMAKEKSGGLEGVIAGRTAIATVGKEGKGLTYRGYSIYDLAEHSSFEEVAYLLVYGQLPGVSQLHNYKDQLVQLRGLPGPLKTVLEQIPRDTHP